MRELVKIDSYITPDCKMMLQVESLISVPSQKVCHLWVIWVDVGHLPDDDYLMLLSIISIHSENIKREGVLSRSDMHEIEERFKSDPVFSKTVVLFHKALQEMVRYTENEIEAKNHPH